MHDVAELIYGGHPDDFPDGSVDALNRAITALEAVSPEILTALRAVVDYDWVTEQRDYMNACPEEREEHVFGYLQRLDAFLQQHSAPASSRKDQTGGKQR